METLETAVAAAAVVSIAVGAGVAAVVIVGTTVITDQLAYHGSDTPRIEVDGTDELSDLDNTKRSGKRVLEWSDRNEYHDEKTTYTKENG